MGRGSGAAVRGVVGLCLVACGIDTLGVVALLFGLLGVGVVGVLLGGVGAGHPESDGDEGEDGGEDEADAFDGEFVGDFGAEEGAEDGHGGEECGHGEGLPELVAVLADADDFERSADGAGDAHGHGADGDSVFDWDFAEGLEERRGDDGAADAEETGGEAHDAADGAEAERRGFLLVFGELGPVAEGFPDHGDGDVAEEECEDLLESVAREEVGDEDAGDDGDEGGGHDPLEEVFAEGAFAVVLACGGDGDHGVHDHGGGLVEVLACPIAAGEDEGEGGEHDDAAADAEQSAEEAGDDADAGEGEDVEEGEVHGLTLAAAQGACR